MGAGVVGLQAIATAKRLGGVVKAIDIRKDACTEAESLGAKVVAFDIPQELAIGTGGYAQALDKEWLEIEQRLIGPHLEDADVVILSALVPGEVAPILVRPRLFTSIGGEVARLRKRTAAEDAAEEAGNGKKIGRISEEEFRRSSCCLRLSSAIGCSWDCGGACRGIRSSCGRAVGLLGLAAPVYEI